MDENVKIEKDKETLYSNSKKKLDFLQVIK